MVGHVIAYGLANFAPAHAQSVLKRGRFLGACSPPKILNSEIVFGAF